MKASNKVWTVLNTRPVHRIEFTALREITLLGFEVMLPFEVVHERRPGKRLPVERKYALFPRYLFVHMGDVAEDYRHIASEVQEVQGILCRSRDAWSPLILPQRDVKFIMERSTEAPATELHKALKVGKAVGVDVGGSIQKTKIDAITKKGVKVLLEMFGSMHVVEVPFGSVRAA